MPQITPIAASEVQNPGAWLEAFREFHGFWPWLVPGEVEVTGYGIIGMYQSFLGLGWLFLHQAWKWIGMINNKLRCI